MLHAKVEQTGLRGLFKHGWHGSDIQRQANTSLSQRQHNSTTREKQQTCYDNAGIGCYLPKKVFVLTTRVRKTLNQDHHQESSLQFFFNRHWTVKQFPSPDSYQHFIFQRISKRVLRMNTRWHKDKVSPAKRSQNVAVNERLCDEEKNTIQKATTVKQAQITSIFHGNISRAANTGGKRRMSRDGACHETQRFSTSTNTAIILQLGKLVRGSRIWAVLLQNF